MTRRRVVAFGLWIVALGCAALIGRLPLGRPSVSSLADLDIYRGSVRAWLAGRSLYAFTMDFPSVLAGSLGFTYPPFAALALSPVALLPDPAGDLAWTLASLASVFVLARAVAGSAASGPWRWPAIATILLLSWPVASNVLLGQVSLLVLVLAFVDAVAVPPRWRGVLTGLAGGIKLTPLVFVVYFAATRQWRACRLTAAAFAGTVVLAWLVLPADSWSFWGSRLFQTSYVGDPARADNGSLLGLLLRWSGGTPGGRVAWVIGALGVLALALRAARSRYRAGEDVEAATVIGCAGVAVLPIAWVHYFVPAVVACWLMVASRRPLWVAPGVVGGATLCIASPALATWAPVVLVSPSLPGELPVVLVTAVALGALPRRRRVAELGLSREQPADLQQVRVEA